MLSKGLLPDGDLVQMAQILLLEIGEVERRGSINGVDLSPKEETLQTVYSILEYGLVSLRRIFNSRRAVNRTPPEVLSYIFSLIPQPRQSDHCDDGLRAAFGPFAISPIVDLLPLTRVCHRWRETAVNSKFLWRTLDNTSRKSSATFSRYYSWGRPLNVHVGRVPRTLKLAQFLTKMGHRVREFRTDRIDVMGLMSLISFFGAELTACKLGTAVINDVGHTIISVFKGHTPKLRSLHIDGLLLLPGPMNHFPALTHLLITAHVNRRIPAHGCFAFLKFLSACPNLQVVHLSDLWIDDFGRTGHGMARRSVKLPYLRKFAIAEHFDFDASGWGGNLRQALLPYIDVPSQCLIRLACRWPYQFDTTFESLPCPRSFTSMRIAVSSETQPVLSLTAIDFRLQPRHRGIRVENPITGPPYNTLHGLVEAWVRPAIIASPLFRGILELWVAASALEFLSGPNPILFSLTHLNTLVLDIPQPERRTGASLWQLIPLHIFEGRPVPCPDLRTLCVCVGAGDDLWYLRGLLESRAVGGHPIRRLVIALGSQSPALHQQARDLRGVPEDFTIIDHGDPYPEDLSWERRLPFECRNKSELHAHWPSWN